MPGKQTHPTCFLSYTWESSEHESWVQNLATELQKNGVEVVLDKWDVKYGDDLAHFMEKSVRESGSVIMVCTPTYAKKADAGTGGAGYEKQIVTGEIFQGAPSSKFIPLLRIGSDKEALPSFLKSKYYIDFRNDAGFETKLNDLLHQLHDVPKHLRPSLGPSPFTPSKKRKQKRLTPAQQKDIVMRAGKCLGCGENDIRLLQVHHIRTIAKRGSNKPANLSVLCPNCHQKAEKGLIKPISVADTKTLTREDKPAKPRAHSESKVEQSHIFGPNVGVGSARDVHIYQSPQSISPPSAEHRKSGDDWEIDEEFSLEPDGYRFFSLELGVGDKLSGLVEADGDVSCYALGPNSLQSFEDGYDFNPYWESEDVTKVKVSFKPKSGHKFFFLVYREEEEDEDVSVSVKLRTER